jgi:hypothetical protein
MGYQKHQRTHGSSQPALLDSPKNNSQKSELNGNFENLQIDIDNYNNLMSQQNSTPLLDDQENYAGDAGDGGSGGGFMINRTQK